MSELRLLYLDDDLAIVDKPSGFHTHAPEDEQFQIRKSVNCMALLRDQLGKYVYPVHRLDRATSGVLAFALNKETASAIGAQFAEQKLQKTYYAFVRGWTEEYGLIDRPLMLESSEALPAKTEYWRVHCAELPFAVGKYETARYSLVKIRLHTGRRHQIRRHFNGIAHPLIGDTKYGDSAHNRFFRETLGVQTLLLKAYALEFTHPRTGEKIQCISKWNPYWHKVFDQLNACPFLC